MATTLSVVKASPSSVVFLFQSDGDGASVHFQASGAGPGDVDLTALVPGNLKRFLTRLPNWGALFYLPPLFKSYNVEWFLTQSPTGGGTLEFPTTVSGVTHLGHADGLTIVQDALQGIRMSAGVNNAPAFVYFGLRFVHSLVR